MEYSKCECLELLILIITCLLDLGNFEKERDMVVNRHLSIKSSFFQRCSLILVSTVCVYKLSNML